MPSFAVARHRRGSTSSRSSSKPPRARTSGFERRSLTRYAATIRRSARLSRDHGRVRRAVCARGCSRRSPRRTARSVSARRRAGDRGARDRALRRRGAARATRRSPACSSTRRRARRVYEPNDWSAPYASGSAKVDAYVDLPVLDGDPRDDRLRRDAEPHSPRRLGRAEGGAPARAHAARDAAVGDPSQQHADAARGRARRSSSSRPASTTAPRPCETSSTSSSRGRSTSSGSSTRSLPRWGQT